jgi:probable HAF family extracellular repeat protein
LPTNLSQPYEQENMKPRACIFERKENFPMCRRTLIFLRQVTLIVCAFLTLTAAQALALQYAIVELGTLGGTQSFALDLNNHGQVTGNARTAANVLHTFLWEDGIMVDLGILPENTVDFSRGFAINELGQITGESDNNIPKAFLFEPGTNMLINIGDLGGGSAFGADINDAGQIVGSSSNGLRTRAFLFSDGVMQDLETLLGTQDSFARAWGINSFGDVVGFSRNAADTASHATLWSNGQIIDLGSFGGQDAFSEALAINDLGQIVGRSTVAGATDQRAFLWENNTMTNLGTVAGLKFSRANDINEFGLVVGTASQFEGFSGNGFRWANGIIADLNALLPANSGWLVTSAEGVNDLGQIVGFGAFNGQTRAFLMTPDALASVDRLLEKTLEAEGIPVNRKNALLHELLRSVLRPLIFAEALPDNGRAVARKFRAAMKGLTRYGRMLSTLQAAEKIPPEVATPLLLEAAEIRTVLQHLLASL